MHNQVSVLENETHNLHRDFEILMDQLISDYMFEEKREEEDLPALKTALMH